MMSIKSVSHDQQEILTWIRDLYTGAFEIDVTYGNGSFYKGRPDLMPSRMFDIEPKATEVLPFDCTALPDDAGTVSSIIFDPPFIATGHKRKSKGIMQSRFSSYPTMRQLWEFYSQALHKFYFVLAPKGYAIVKCQDVVHDHKNYLSHVYLINEAERIGFYCKDIFILLASNRMTRKGQLKQEHARKYHSYFLVLQKRKVNFSNLEGIR